MTHTFSRHLRGTLPPAEHIQADPLTVMKSIERAEIIWAFTIVAACVVIAGALNIIGGNA